MNAQQTAQAVAKERGFPEPRRMLDTFNDDAPAWTVTRGVVVYEDEPDCLVSLGVEPGRWTATA